MVSGTATNNWVIQSGDGVIIPATIKNNNKSEFKIPA